MLALWLSQIKVCHLKIHRYTHHLLKNENDRAWWHQSWKGPNIRGATVVWMEEKLGTSKVNEQLTANLWGARKFWRILTTTQKSFSEESLCCPVSFLNVLTCPFLCFTKLYCTVQLLCGAKRTYRLLKKTQAQRNLMQCLCHEVPREKLLWHFGCACSLVVKQANSVNCVPCWLFEGVLEHFWRSTSEGALVHQKCTFYCKYKMTFLLRSTVARS